MIGHVHGLSCAARRLRTQRLKEAHRLLDEAYLKHTSNSINSNNNNDSNNINANGLDNDSRTVVER